VHRELVDGHHVPVPARLDEAEVLELEHHLPQPVDADPQPAGKPPARSWTGRRRPRRSGPRPQPPAVSRRPAAAAAAPPVRPPAAAARPRGYAAARRRARSRAATGRGSTARVPPTAYGVHPPMKDTPVSVARRSISVTAALTWADRPGWVAVRVQIQRQGRDHEPAGTVSGVRAGPDLGRSRRLLWTIDPSAAPIPGCRRCRCCCRSPRTGRS
jgi:DNA polymerase-3 subunit gamma/tau